MLAIDTETTGLNQWAPGFKVFMAQWADASAEYVADENTGWDPFLRAIEQHEVLVLANASYDIHALRQAGIVDLLDERWRVHDVQTLARVAIPGRFSYKLEKLGDDLLGLDSTQGQRELAATAKLHKVSWTQKNKDYRALWKLEPALMERYGKEDVRLTWDLWKLIYGRASAADREVYRMEIAGVAPLLREAERDGVLWHPGRMAELRKRMESERDEMRYRLLAQGLSDAALGVELAEDDDEDATRTPASTKALLRDLLACGVPLYKLTPASGQVKKNKDGTSKRGEYGKALRNPSQLAVNKDALVEFQTRFPIVGDLMAWRGRKQILTTYVEAIESAGGRVHCSFSQCQARTSRMSCSRPNMQNLPTPEKEREDGTHDVGVRHVLVPAPGNAFVVVDYDSIEVRVLVHYLGISRAVQGRPDVARHVAELIAELDAGMDMHQRTAFKIAAARGEGCSFENFVKGGPRDKDRTKAKTTTFTALYGGGARLLSTRLNVPVEEAAQIKTETLAAIPGYYELDDSVKALVRHRSFPHVVTIKGRRLYVPKDKPYVAMNTLIQGTAAELMKLGMIAAAPVYAPLGYRLRLVVHDELVLEGPATCADEALAGTISAMESAYPLRPRLKATGSWSTDSYGKAK